MPFKAPAFKVEQLTAKFVKGQLLGHAGVPVRAHTCLFLRFNAKMSLLPGSICHWVLPEPK